MGKRNLPRHRSLPYRNTSRSTPPPLQTKHQNNLAISYCLYTPAASLPLSHLIIIKVSPYNG